MDMTKGDDTKILREVWLRAAAQENGLEIDCKTESSAKYWRLKLYRVASKARKMSAVDPELHAACMQLSVLVEPTRPGILQLVKTAQHGLLGEIAKQIGFDPREEEDREIRESQERVKRMLEEQPAKPVRSTPYYTRES